MEYRIEISMTPDEDMVAVPYHWCVLGRDKWEWFNCGVGWATSQEAAWEQAYKRYQSLILM